MEEENKIPEDQNTPQEGSAESSNSNNAVNPDAPKMPDSPPPMPEAPSIDMNFPSEDQITASYAQNRLDVSPVSNLVNAVHQEIRKVVIGQTEVIDLLLASILTGGHCLLEGYPGIAKTLTAKMMARSMNASFGRIQFTPDLMPTDITGTSVFSMKDSEFHFKKGPIFSSIILIDEINRAPAKTQAALMEVMEEKQITYDGITYKMESPFFVIATQNPIEQEGTYLLPEAQLDRFLFRIKVEYPTYEEEKKILELFQSDFQSKAQEQVKSIIPTKEIERCKEIIEKVYIKPELIRYIAAVIDNTRNNGDLFLGASPRASLSIMRSAKALAAMGSRDFVSPDDIKRVCVPVLNHRIILSHEREMEGSTVEDVIKEILETVEVPR